MFAMERAEINVTGECFLLLSHRRFVCIRGEVTGRRRARAPQDNCKASTKCCMHMDAHLAVYGWKGVYMWTGAYGAREFSLLIQHQKRGN